MAALSSTIQAEDLALAGVTGSLAAALLGLTWIEAKAKLSVILGLAAGNEALSRGAVVSYTINGRTVSASMAMIEGALKAIRTALSFATPTGGISAMPVEFG
jgi:hypothetical protein